MRSFAVPPQHPPSDQPPSDRPAPAAGDGARRPTSGYKYSAFLSYSHKDTAWGTWIHKALETYRIDGDLVGRETLAGAVPKTLRPIFRDREDFSAGHSLGDQTQAALHGSKFLVVVCSPNAARSTYVNEEIRSYKAAGGANNVIPIIVDGEPGDPERDCFPPALRFKVGPDGALTDDREEPIAADARPEGDGKRIAVLKLVAGLLGVGLDEIVRRADRAHRRRLRAWIGALTVLAAVLAGLAIWAEINRREAEVQRRHAVAALAAASRTSNKLIYDLATRFQSQKGVPLSLIRDILKRAQSLQDELTSSGQTSADLQHNQASALLETARVLAQAGDPQDALTAAERARTIDERLLADDPTANGDQVDLGSDYEVIGDALSSLGRRDEADAAYQKARALASGLVGKPGAAAGRRPQAEVTKEAFENQHAPLEDSARFNQAVADEKTGDNLLGAGKPAEALPLFQQAADAFKALLDASPHNAEYARTLGTSYESMGGALMALKRFDEAYDAYQRRLAVAQHMVDDTPSNTEYRRDLSVAKVKMGDIYAARGQTAAALDMYRSAVTIRETLVGEDPANPIWQRDLAVARGELGVALVNAGKPDDALASLEAGLAVERDMLAKAPNDVQVAHDVVISQAMIGNVLARMSRPAEALARYREALSITQAQRRLHPDDGSWADVETYCRQRIAQLSGH